MGRARACMVFVSIALSAACGETEQASVISSNVGAAGESAGFAGTLAGTGGSQPVAGASGVGGTLPSPPLFTRYAADAERSPVTASVAARAAAIAKQGPNQKNDVFMKVGASGTVSKNLLHCFSGNPSYVLDLAGHEHLMPTIEFFRKGDAQGKTPFDRVSLAAEVGQTSGWAISGSPSPLVAEMNALSPRYAFVNYGTNDMGAAKTYEAALALFYENMETLLDTLEQAGIVPIVTGLNPRGDSQQASLFDSTFSLVTLGIAEKRQIPFIHLLVASEKLPNQGLVSDGVHGNVYTVAGKAQPCVFTTEGLKFNYNARNLLSIEALHHISRALGGAPTTESSTLPPLKGEGTDSNPWVIDVLPFTHASNTQASSVRTIDVYGGCKAPQNESGPERHYVLDLAAPMPLRIVLLDRGSVDVDLHLLDGSKPPTGDACIARDDRMLERYVGLGPKRIVVDTFVSSTGEKPGEYLLVVLPCEPGDSACF